MSDPTEQEQIDPWKVVARWHRDGDGCDHLGCAEDHWSYWSDIDVARAADAAQVRERDAQIARLSEQVERQTTALRSIAQWCPSTTPGTDWQGSGNYDDAYNAGSDDAYWALGQIALAALTAPQEV